MCHNYFILRLIVQGIFMEIQSDKFQFFTRHKQTILYGMSMAILLFFLRWIELKFVVFNHSYEIFVGLLALLFTSLGIWLALKLSKPKVEIQTVIVEKEVYVSKEEEFTPNEALIQQLEISKRELEILHLISQGLKNEEIAQQLFVSLSTVKTHNQNLFAKLDVQRRTQAIEKAKRLKLIA